MRHTMRGVITAWLTLIALQTVGTAGGSGRVAGALSTLDGLLRSALDPNVPAIPDRRPGAAATQYTLPLNTPTGTGARTPVLGAPAPQ